MVLRLRLQLHLADCGNDDNDGVGGGGAGLEARWGCRCVRPMLGGGSDLIHVCFYYSYCREGDSNCAMRTIEKFNVGTS